MSLALALMSAGPVSASSQNGNNWYDSFWPLGDQVEVHKLSEEYIPFKSVGEIPARPELFIELGDPFLDTGNLYEGFEVPLIGAVWQPRLWSYFINRTAIQTFDTSTVGRNRDSEIANRLNLFVNLQLTGTEKILLGLRPTDANQPSRFTRHRFSGDDQDTNSEFNTDVETLFFEGDLGSLFPVLDPRGMTPLDFGFTVGRQPINFQEGIIINDTVDALGFVRNNIVVPHTSNFRVSGMWAWDRLDRNDRSRQSDPNMYGLFTAADMDVSTFNLDIIYVDDNATVDADGLNVGFSAIQRIRSLGGLSTAFRINHSFALDNEVGGNVVGDGTLLTVELSRLVHGSDDIVYLNPFWSIGNYTQAGREAVVGGPLGSIGILFASAQLSLYGAELSPFTDDVAGFATGYQAFWDHHRRNLTIEIAARHDTGATGGFDSLGIGFQLQQAIGRHFQLQPEAFYTLNEGENDGAGLRFEVLVVY
jgi:hypothetical protein